MPDRNRKVSREGAPAILLVHPPIYDFTAFDFYVYPLGLLKLAAAFRDRGFFVQLVDALDRFVELPRFEGSKGPSFRADGCGHFYHTPIPKPQSIQKIPRNYNRFGLPPAVLRERLIQAGKPAAVAITCTMTYWYPGAVEVVETVRTLWPDTPVFLGGTYPSLCPEHALRTCQADCSLSGTDITPLFEHLPKPQGKPQPYPISPCHDLVGARTSAAVQSTVGCPRRCPYCASFLLAGPFKERGISTVLDEIAFLVEKQGRQRIAFYDDALLERGEEAVLELTREIVRRGFHQQASFHCPNGLRASSLTAEIARALREAHFKTIRLGFETADADLQSSLGQKVSNQDLEEALRNLRAAGYSTRDIGVYVMAGLPGQEPESVEQSLRFVHNQKAQARLAEYAAVPGTPLFKKAQSLSLLDLEEPLNHNKTLAPYRFASMDPTHFRILKDQVRRLNNRLLATQ